MTLRADLPRLRMEEMEERRLRSTAQLCVINGEYPDLVRRVLPNFPRLLAEVHY